MITSFHLMDVMLVNTHVARVALTATWECVLNAVQDGPSKMFQMSAYLKMAMV